MFNAARFSRDAAFYGAQFFGGVYLYSPRFSGDARFRGAQFATAGEYGPMRVAGHLDLDKVTFGAPVVLKASASRLSCLDTTFKDVSSLRLRRAQIAFDGAALGKPSTISFARGLVSPGRRADEAKGMDNPGERPRIVSLRRTDLANLVVADCDLSSCLFEGAHNLDKLRVEGPPPFGPTPSDWFRLRLWRLRLPIGRLTRRQALAEEHQWRSLRSNATPAPDSDTRTSRIQAPLWYATRCHPPDWLIKGPEPPDVLSADRVAVLYRGLRKALEDGKNAPGAADFYYGEMEMRRLSSTSSWSDRLVLWTYWLISGYGLRASRALAAFAAMVMLFSGAFWAWGLVGHPTYWIALLRAFESATSLLRPAPAGLSPVGELLDAVLRLLGTTLLGLAIFSLRGRIKR